MRALAYGLLGLGALGCAASWHDRHHEWRHGADRFGFSPREPGAGASDLTAALGVRRGDRIAAVGVDDALLEALATAVGESGRVHAVALGERRASDLEALVKQRQASNVFVVLATPDDPRLPSAGIDLALVHAAAVVEGGSPIFLDRVRASLAPGGRVALLGGETCGRPWFGAEGHRAWHVAQWGLRAARLEEVARFRAQSRGKVVLYAARDAA
jgi:hypothetical protein